MAELRYKDPSAVPGVVSALSSVFQRTTEINGRIIHRPAPRHHRAFAFHGRQRPNITVQSYLERIFRHADCSPTCYVIAYIYLDRFTQRHPPVIIDSFNVHRLLITSILTAIKFMERIQHNNAYFANVGGISLAEMNNLEINFLFGVGFNLNVIPTVYYSYCSLLREEIYRLESLPAPPRFQCCLMEEESNDNL